LKRIQFGFRTLVTGTIVSVVLITLLVVLPLVGKHIGDTTRELIGKEMAQTAFVVGLQLERAREDQVRDLRTLAELLRQQGTNSIERMESVLLDFRRSNPGFDHLYLVDEHSLVIASAPSGASPTTWKYNMLLNEGWFGAYVADVALCTVKDKPQPEEERQQEISAAIPIQYSGGRPHLVLIGSVAWRLVENGFEELLRPMRDQFNMDTYVIRLSDFVVIHGPKERMGRELQVDLPAGLLPRTLRWQEDQEGGKNYVSGYAIIQSSPQYRSPAWVVIIRQNTDIAYGPLRQFSWFMISLGLGLCVVYAVLGGVAAHRMIGPLMALHKNVEAFEAGQLERISIQRGVKEIENLSVAFSCLVSTLSNTQAERDQLEELMGIDALTGLGNRKAIDDYLADLDAWKDTKRLRLTLFIDLDGFKTINDTLGHSAGDEVLKACGMRIRNAVRQDSLCARLGGDEYLILCVINSRAEAIKIGGRIVNLLGKTIRLPSEATNEISAIKVAVSSSIGGAIWPFDAHDPREVTLLADQAMYQAKRNGKNQFVLWKPELMGCSDESGRGAKV